MSPVHLPPVEGLSDPEIGKPVAVVPVVVKKINFLGLDREDFLEDEPVHEVNRRGSGVRALVVIEFGLVVKEEFLEIDRVPLLGQLLYQGVLGLASLLVLPEKDTHRCEVRSVFIELFIVFNLMQDLHLHLGADSIDLVLRGTVKVNFFGDVLDRLHKLRGHYLNVAEVLHV